MVPVLNLLEPGTGPTVSGTGPDRTDKWTGPDRTGPDRTEKNLEWSSSSSSLVEQAGSARGSKSVAWKKKISGVELVGSEKRGVHILIATILCSAHFPRCFELESHKPVTERESRVMMECVRGEGEEVLVVRNKQVILKDYVRGYPKETDFEIKTGDVRLSCRVLAAHDLGGSARGSLAVGCRRARGRFNRDSATVIFCRNLERKAGAESEMAWSSSGRPHRAECVLLFCRNLKRGAGAE